MCWVMPPASRACHVGVPDRVEQLGLAVVDVTHDGDHRRAGHQVGLVALVLAELDVERLEQLAILFLGRDDLDVVVQLGAEQLERLVVDRLGRRHHLAEVEHHLHQRRGVGADLVGEVGQARAPAQPDYLAVAARNLHAADRRRLHVVKLLTPLLLRLAAARRTPAGPAEGTLGTAAATAAARTRRATAGSGARSAAATGTTATGTRTAAATGTAATAATAAGPGARSGTRAAAACAGTAPARAGRRGARGHVHRARPGTAGSRTREPAGSRTAIGYAGTLGPAGAASARTRPAGGAAGRTGTAFPARRTRALGPRRRRGTHAGRGRAERVVTRPGAGTRGTGTPTRSAGPGRPGTGSTRSLRPGRGRPGTLTALILTASGGAGALAALAIARRSWTRRRGPGAARPLAPARAAEVGRSGRGARRPGHPRGAGSLLGPLFGRPGDRRRRDRRQLPGRRVSRVRCRRGAGRGGTVGRSRSLRGTVGRPVGRGRGGRRGSGHGVAGTLRRRSPAPRQRRAAAWRRPQARRRAARPGRPAWAWNPEIPGQPGRADPIP